MLFLVLCSVCSVEYSFSLAHLQGLIMLIAVLFYYTKADIYLTVPIHCNLFNLTVSWTTLNLCTNKRLFEEGLFKSPFQGGSCLFA